MLDITVHIEGDKVVIENLGTIAANLPRAIKRGLEHVAQGIHREAHRFLSGAGGMSKKKRTDYTGFTKKSGKEVGFVSYEGAGAYPVPVRSGFLRQALDWLAPDATKAGVTGHFTAGPDEAIVYNSALYANVIHEGRGSSAKFGPRRYLTDALEAFNQGGRIAEVISQEIAREIKR